MFGLTEQEMNLYKDLAQDFAVRDVTPLIISNSQFLTPLIDNGEGEPVPNAGHVRQLVTDIELIITLTTINMAIDYAHLQVESDKSETDIIEFLHNKYENYLVSQFIKYGVAFTVEALSDITGEIILELPYLYMAVIEDEEFDEDSFLEERMEAYNEYLTENFVDEEVDEEDF